MADRFLTHRMHGRRKGKPLTNYRQGLLDDDLAHYQIDLSSFGLTKGSGAIQTDSPINSENDTYQENWLEIGFGNGEFLSHMSQHNPGIQFIGCEPFINGVAALLASLDDPVDNLKIWSDDARLLIDAMPDACIDRIYLLNPDPWRKTRHEKRRFVQTETLSDLARILKPNGTFTMSTDVVELANWMHEKTFNHGAFEWLSETPDDWTTPPTDWPLDKTRYMKKALGGETIYWLKFKRIE